ncbi:MAG TPA: CARDB domain-containing protein [Methanofastidiosum sp.]|nr:CARDB domain-containing protein [Methanofastidiosum sp.]HNU60838.1 CARDB domain-containing protein [Methanofastidiosum sp.]
MNQIVQILFIIFLISFPSFFSISLIQAQNEKSNIQIGDITWFPKNPKKGENIEFIIKINNNTGTNYNNINLECYLNSDLIESKTIKEIKDSSTFEYNFTWVATTSDFKIKSIIYDKNYDKLSSFSKIYFSGYSWYIKNSIDQRKGPSFNYWSDSDENIWVDEKGLHLKIVESEGRWYCSEVYSEDSFSYGKYIFYLDGRPDLFDRNIVLGLFTYYYNSQIPDKNVEIDIEFSKWGSNLPNLLARNSQYVIHPLKKQTIHRYKMILNGDYSVHYFNWKKDSIEFKSLHGHNEATNDRRFVIADKKFFGRNIPVPTTETKVHINLWLYDSNEDKKGDSPLNREESQIIIKSFRFE